MTTETETFTFEQLAGDLSLSPDMYFIHDVSTEEYREYEFVAANSLFKTVYRINSPRVLIVRKEGTTHRVIDSRGIGHCIPFGGTVPVVLRWKNLIASACEF